MKKIVLYHVNLTEKADQAVARLMEIKGLSKTDVINRAVQQSEFFERELLNGSRVYVSEPTKYRFLRWRVYRSRRVLWE